MRGFAEAEKAPPGSGILRGGVGGGRAQVEGFVEDFGGEDCVGGCWRVGTGEEGMRDVGV